MTNLSIASNSQIEQTAAKIAEFRNLAVGWRFGEGVPPTLETIYKALILNQAAAAVLSAETNAFPGVNGEIQVTVYRGPDYLEFTIESDGKITFIHEEVDEEVEHTPNLSLGEALEKLQSIGGLRWAISDWFAESNMIRAKGVSIGWHLIPLKRTAVSLSSTRNVPIKPVEESARTLRIAIRNTIEGIPIILTSFGASPIMPYREPVGSITNPLKMTPSVTTT